jgi:hypothetical protein
MWSDGLKLNEPAAQLCVATSSLTVVRRRNYSYTMIHTIATTRVRLASVALKMQAAAPEGIV